MNGNKSGNATVIYTNGPKIHTSTRTGTSHHNDSIWMLRWLQVIYDVNERAMGDFLDLYFHSTSIECSKQKKKKSFVSRVKTKTALNCHPILTEWSQSLWRMQFNSQFHLSILVCERTTEMSRRARGFSYQKRANVIRYTSWLSDRLLYGATNTFCCFFFSFRSPKYKRMQSLSAVISTNRSRILPVYRHELYFINTFHLCVSGETAKNSRSCCVLSLAYSFRYGHAHTLCR